MTWKTIRWFLAVAALGAIIGLGNTPSASQASGRVGHLEAHGKVVWVLEAVYDGEILGVQEGAVKVSARDLDPASPTWCGDTCDSGDQVSLTINGGTKITQGGVETGFGPGSAVVHGLGGLDLAFVDGGEPGTRAVAPPNQAGISPTADYVQWLQVSPAYYARGYFLTGGVQVIDP